MIGAAAVGGGLFGLMLLGFRKVTRFRTGGFYRDTFRPFLMACAFAGLAGSIAALRLSHRHDADRAHVIVLLVCATVVLLFTLIVRGRKYRKAALEPNAVSDAALADQERQASAHVTTPETTPSA
jgi:hypothetical protein